MIYLLIAYASIFGSMVRDLIFEVPYTSKKQNISSLQNSDYFVKNLPRKTFFPAYAKMSKMINGNRYGKHINLERRLKGRSLKWK